MTPLVIMMVPNEAVYSPRHYLQTEFADNSADGTCMAKDVFWLSVNSD